MTKKQRTNLEARSLAVLATGRRDGSPQQSLVSYFFDGEALLMSVTGDRAKYRNGVRQPRVSVLVVDGRQQVVVYGVASFLEGSARDDAIRAIRMHQGNPLPQDYDLEAFSNRLDELGRVVLRVVPEHVLGLERGRRTRSTRAGASSRCRRGDGDVEVGAGRRRRRSARA